MNKKEYLTEENYEKGKNTLGKFFKIVLSVGLSISLLLIISGIIVIATSNNETSNNDTSVNETEKINNDIAEIDRKINELKMDLPSLNAQKSSEFRKNGFSQKYYELEQQIDNIESQIRDLESEKYELENDLEYSSDFILSAFEEPKSIFKKGLGGILIFIGLGLIPSTLMISGFIFFIYKRREIAVFTTQQTMPIAQEGIEKMAPTIGEAAGSIGKEIAKGIKEGINEANNNQQK